ncbi:hypothetical protein EUX98_g9115 [Antrodiella citrinella]|uniref:JmjC domain-containing protein n=1 Tax=Antrodiella citrinella TaxID=2447956 RepID=A0A4S4LXX2_9APHY|nr:hypothetical protein EUX98_g9115 [Antrodiella citrinella]
MSELNPKALWERNIEADPQAKRARGLGYVKKSKQKKAAAANAAQGSSSSGKRKVQASPSPSQEIKRRCGDSSHQPGTDSPSQASGSIPFLTAEVASDFLDRLRALNNTSDIEHVRRLHTLTLPAVPPAVSASDDLLLLSIQEMLDFFYLQRHDPKKAKSQRKEFFRRAIEHGFVDGPRPRMPSQMLETGQANAPVNPSSPPLDSSPKPLAVELDVNVVETQPSFSSTASQTSQIFSSAGVQTVHMFSSRAVQTAEAPLSSIETTELLSSTLVPRAVVPPPIPQTRSTVSDSEHSLDLMHVDGQEILVGAEVIKWLGDIKTKGPYLPDGKGGNYLHHDLQYVQSLVGAVLPATELPLYTELQWTAGLPDTVLVSRVQRALRAGHFVVVKGYPRCKDPNTIKWTEELIWDHYSLPMNREMQLLDAHKRYEARMLYLREVEKIRELKNKKKYKASHDRMPELVSHTYLSMKDIIHNVFTGKYVAALLDAPSVDNVSLLFMKHLDVGFSAMFHNKAHNVEPYRMSIPRDVQSSQSWLLAHLPGFHTYPHYDSNSLGTVVVVEKGQKLWVYEYSPGTGTARMQAEFFEAMDAHKGMEHTFTGNSVSHYLVVAEEGDILIQGPGQWHEVYTPVPSVAAARPAASRLSKPLLAGRCLPTQQAGRALLSLYGLDTDWRRPVAD